jgi:cytosine/adenosine deaminase-related metal-dependent hydrolase
MTDTLLLDSARHTTTPAMVCAHHHLYSALARGMPAPPRQPDTFLSVLEQIWWRLDAALDLDMIYWSAALGAAEAVMSGTTCIIDHHESPGCIEGSLDAIEAGCALVGVRVLPAYGVTDRWDNGTLREVTPATPMSDAARLGLSETENRLRAGKPTMVGVHAAFTCGDETLRAAADLAERYNVGVHIHVAEGPDDLSAGSRLAGLSRDNWLIVHAVHLQEHLRGTIVHNPRSNLNNAVGYARPARFSNPIALGTDGIGADMLDEFRLAFVAAKSSDLSTDPTTVWSWLEHAQELFPASSKDAVRWSYDHMDSPWHLAFSTGVHVRDVHIGGKAVVVDGEPVSFDLQEIRSKAAEQAARLHARL